MAASEAVFHLGRPCCTERNTIAQQIQTSMDAATTLRCSTFPQRATYCLSQRTNSTHLHNSWKKKYTIVHFLFAKISQRLVNICVDLTQFTVTGIMNVQMYVYFNFTVATFHFMVSFSKLPSTATRVSLREY